MSNLSDRASCYGNLVSACKSQENTLSGEISYMDSQIKLTTIQIETTKEKINTLLDEITQLETEVQRLEGVLNTRLALLLHRIPAAYKRSVASQFGMLLFSHNLSDFIDRAKYLSAVQKEDASLVFQVKATQNSYNESKQVREDKKKQLEKIQQQLIVQSAQLEQQKESKNALLAATQGNEDKYSQLRQQALAQIAAIQGFVTGAGGASVLQNQTVCDDWGCYYNQRDAQWAGYTLGSSSYSVAESGCLITSVAMVATHYKKDIKPGDLATNASLFFDSTGFLYQGTISVKGASITRYSGGTIDSELAAGRPVIVGVYRGPAHFIVLKSGSNGNYTMNDPFWPSAHDVSFSSHYNVSDITEVDTISVN